MVVPVVPCSIIGVGSLSGGPWWGGVGKKVGTGGCFQPKLTCTKTKLQIASSRVKQTRSNERRGGGGGPAENYI